MGTFILIFLIGMFVIWFLWMVKNRHITAKNKIIHAIVKKFKFITYLIKDENGYFHQFIFVVVGVVLAMTLTDISDGRKERDKTVNMLRAAVHQIEDLRYGDMYGDVVNCLDFDDERFLSTVEGHYKHITYPSMINDLLKSEMIITNMNSDTYRFLNQANSYIDTLIKLFEEEEQRPGAPTKKDYFYMINEYLSLKENLIALEIHHIKKIFKTRKQLENSQDELLDKFNEKNKHILSLYPTDTSKQ